MKNIEKLLQAMSDFKKSYDELLIAIDHYETDTDSSVNDLPGFAESYPFDVSLDELPLEQWIADIAERNCKIKFQVIDYEYLNTGGNTMVGIHEVWLPDEMKTIYCFTNEEGCTIAPVDYIRNDNIEANDVLTIDFDWGRVTGYEKYFELLRQCWNDYTRDDCKYFGITRRAPYYLLSDELQSKVDVDYLVWTEANSDGMIETDGVCIVEDENYTAQFEELDCEVSPDEDYDKWLQELKDFREWHNNLVNTTTTDEELDELYTKDYILTFNGKVIRLPYHADTFCNVDMLLKRAIEEW